MTIPDYSSELKVDRWLKKNVGEEYNQQNDDINIDTISLGKSTSTFCRRFFEKILQILSITFYKPSKFYEKRGRARLLAHNLTEIEKSLIQQKCNNRELDPQKVGKITEKVKTQLSFVNSRGLISDEALYNYRNHKEVIDRNILRYQLTNNDNAPVWLNQLNINFDTVALEKLKIVDLIRKKQRGDHLWDATQGAEAGENLEILDDYFTFLQDGMGESLAEYFKAELQGRPNDKLSIYRQILELDERFTAINNRFKDHKMVDVVTNYLKTHFQENAPSLALAEQLEVTLGYLDVAFHRYGNLTQPDGTNAGVGIRFYEYILTDYAKIFSDQGLAELQDAFHWIEWANVIEKVNLQSLKDIIHLEIRDGKHYLETDGLRVYRLCCVAGKGSFGQSVSKIAELPLREMEGLLTRLNHVEALYREYGLEAFFKSQVSEWKRQGELNLSVSEYLTAFLNQMEVYTTSLNGLKEVKDAYFNSKLIGVMFVRSAASTINYKMRTEHKDLNRSLSEVYDNYRGILNYDNPANRIDFLCEVFAQALNLTAEANVFSVDFVKDYLLNNDMETSVERLQQWALFAKGKNPDQIQNFIADFDHPLFDNYFGLEGENKKKYSSVMSKLYTTYHMYNNEGQTSALWDILKDATSIQKAIHEKDLRKFERNVNGIRKLIEFSDKVGNKNVYDRELIYLALQFQFENVRDIYELADSLDGFFIASNDEKAFYVKLFELFIIQKANLEVGGESDQLIQGLMRIFKNTHKLPTADRLSYVRMITMWASKWHREGFSCIHILNELQSAKALVFDLDRIDRLHLDQLPVAMDAIQLELKNKQILIERRPSADNIINIVNANPARILTVLLPAFVEPLLDSPKDKNKMRAVQGRLSNLEGTVNQLGFVETIKSYFVENKQVLQVLVALPSTDINTLVQEILSDLREYSQCLKDNQPVPDNRALLTILATQIVNGITNEITKKFVNARHAKINQQEGLDLDFYNSMMDLEKVTNNPISRLGLRFAPAILSMVGGSGAFGEWIMKLPLSIIINAQAQVLPPEDREAFTAGLAPIIRVISLAVSSLIQRHEIDRYIGFLKTANEFMQQETRVAVHEQEAFKREVWGLINQIIIDISEYPVAVEKLLLALRQLSVGEK